MAGNINLPDFNVFNALGLRPSLGITLPEVRSAYRRAFLHVHPDKEPPEGHFPNHLQAEQAATYEQTFFPEFGHGDDRVFQARRPLPLILSLDFGSSMSAIQAATTDGSTVFHISQYPRAMSGRSGRGSDMKEVPTLAYYKPSARTPGLEFGYPPGHRGGWEAVEHLKSLIDPQQAESPPAKAVRDKLQGRYPVDNVLIGMLTFLHNHARDQLQKVCGRYEIIGFVASIPCTYGKPAQQRYERLLGEAGWPVEVLQWVWEPEAVGFSALADAPVLRSLSREKGGATVLIIDLGGLTCDAIGFAIESFGPQTGTHITREVAAPVGHFGGSGMARYVFEGWIAQHHPDQQQDINRLFDDFWGHVMILKEPEHMDLSNQVDISLEQVQGILDAIFSGVFEFLEEQLGPMLNSQAWDAIVLSGGTS
ncbi:hypothetical protein NPX13_g8686 [Xylaria arbuscula]|uniref:J domain-containing protein n=1 Tax=Xylaria arbuscula TaxID=114810 RepID=A0A9W8TJX3_9PEZI|nr:hypothetical protein NPX13_g8686 [Xylaria arbuscula]